jgi:hypothetical protein
MCKLLRVRWEPTRIEHPWCCSQLSPCLAHKVWTKMEMLHKVEHTSLLRGGVSDATQSLRHFFADFWQKISAQQGEQPSGQFTGRFKLRATTSGKELAWFTQNVVRHSCDHHRGMCRCLIAERSSLFSSFVYLRHPHVKSDAKKTVKVRILVSFACYFFLLSLAPKINKF